MLPPDVMYVIQQRKTQPYTHENGFVQLPITDNLRLHVWPGDLMLDASKGGPFQKQKSNSPIHDHRFDFESEILCGALTHIEYRTIEHPEGEYIVHTYAGKPGERSALTSLNVRVRATAYIETTYKRGDDYQFGARRFHESKAATLTATLMRKSGSYEIAPRVLCPVGEEPDNAFDRDTANAPALLWYIIDQAVVLAGRTLR